MAAPKGKRLNKVQFKIYVDLELFNDMEILFNNIHTLTNNRRGNDRHFRPIMTKSQYWESVIKEYMNQPYNQELLRFLKGKFEIDSSEFD